MTKRIDLTRRQFVNASIVSLGLFGMTGKSNIVLAQESESTGDRLSRAGRGENTEIPYIAMTGDGPLYPAEEIPWLKDLTSVGGAQARPSGQVLYLFGRILDANGRPLPNASAEIWQADNGGNYKHPRAPQQDRLDPNFGYFGKVRTAQDGTYLFKTLVPRWYGSSGSQRAAHIHLKMRHLQQGVLTTEMYFEGKEDEDIRSRDRVFLGRSSRTRDRMIVPKESPQKYSYLEIAFEQDALCCQYDLAFL